METYLPNVCDILDNLRKPINTIERKKRIIGKPKSELYPYYGATGQVGYIDDYLTDGEYVLIGEDGAPFLDYTKPVAYMIKGKTWVNNHAHILKSFFNNDYLLHYLNQFQYRDFVTGTTRLKLTQGALKRMSIKLAPLPEQRAIVTKIENLFASLDKGIADLKKAQDQLKVYRQAVLKKAFEGELTKEWREKNVKTDGRSSQEKNITAIVAELEPEYKQINHKKNKFPEEWKLVKLSEITEHITDGDHQAPPKTKEGIPFITISNIDKKNNKIDFSSTFYVKTDYYKNLNIKRVPHKGDILYTVTGSFGIPVLIDFDKKFCFQRHIGLIRPKKDINQDWLFHLLKTQLVYGQASEKATGTAQKTVALSTLRNIQIPFCSNEEQHQIVREIESRLSVCDNIEQSITEGLQRSEALRQSILKKAFEGKLLSEAEIEKCKQEADYEPASVLLERIKKEKKK
mgnify:FL=1